MLQNLHMLQNTSQMLQNAPQKSALFIQHQFYPFSMRPQQKTHKQDDMRPKKVINSKTHYPLSRVLFTFLVPQTCVLMSLNNAWSRLFLWAWRFAEWALKYHSAAASLCANVESKVQGKALQSGLILCFCRRRNFALVYIIGLTFLLCSKTFCCAVKPSVVQ